MECFYTYGASRKHHYKKFKTLFLRKIKYRCSRCGKTIGECEYTKWKLEIEERKKLIALHLKGVFNE